nr:NTP transferase domain-containing protein [Bacilli bacterium]
MNIEDFLIDEQASIVEAMALLDKIPIFKKILFVVRDGRFVAALTDGDIRRWVLKKGNLDACVKDIANYKPQFAYESDRLAAKEFIQNNPIAAMPILNDNDEIISILFLNDKEVKPQITLNLPVVIMAGGLGTRLYPYTKILPKPLIPIGEIPIAEHIINRFYEYGIDQFFLVVNHKKNMIKAYFNEIEKGYSVRYVDEDEPLGTGGGLSLLKGKIDSTFILTNGDILIEEDYEKIYKYHKQNHNVITMVCSLKNIKIPYGVIEFSEGGEIKEMKEKPNIPIFVNTGMYVVEPKVIEELDYNQMIDFPDIIEKYMHRKEKVGIYPVSENSWLDMGQLDELEKMRGRLVGND